jgi:type II secretory pathway pseudopilin PulG
MRRGHTLFELCAALLLVALAASAVLPAGRALLDRVAVVAAREAVAGLVAEARVAALSYGGASVHLTAGPWRAWAQVGDSAFGLVQLEEELAVTVELSRGRAATELRYDALGLGQVASETLRFRRGVAASSLVVSGYGRVRRR